MKIVNHKHVENNIVVVGLVVALIVGIGLVFYALASNGGDTALPIPQALKSIFA